MLMIVLTFAVSIEILQGRLQLQLGLLALCCILLVFMWRLKKAGQKGLTGIF
jgi:Ca2+/Na+ antiporter